ncbi:ATP-binding protein [Roseiconus nitratireducens]|uniref:ATP-binding protein n=1 Tax=Roseiconus nitratireducens TaxID=2605748 RepID=A0A5M6CXZ2_9BACT|nr:ATP-binding protein [Roseiconus nitratireducens]KAA5540071.1 ATP-binding protein [Roseiconus nitratireducens]
MTCPDPADFEKLASFYLGRQYDLSNRQLLDHLLMYDAKDLCTHAMCVGMTGSGKTGLCLSLLEEAALDGIPAICVDPKGDLANLMLTFPDLKPEDFQPWLQQSEATRRGITLQEFAQQTATSWAEGLASWGQSPDRIRALKDAAEVSIYTPGSSIGLPLTVLKSFDAPTPEVRADTEALGERITAAVSGLLSLLGMNVDPLTSPEHILIASILRHQWLSGKNVTIGGLIRLIQSPPLDRVGVVDLDTFMPVADRAALAMKLNNLLASPAFASWLEGESLSIQRLLHTADGKPRLSILSISHLSESERMFFVTILLNELVTWMRTQTGTSSLRALFYMDEVAGYFPPVAKPPSKPPMLTLLKQARAFGLGIVLATQNPVDLDYKGLSNIGTWFLGRLQTERDKARVLEGLEGAAGESGTTFDRGAMERILASLGKGVFLMNNVHDDAPVTFQTRWAMSFLAGPLARRQIADLMAEQKQTRRNRLEQAGELVESEAATVARPVVPAGIDELFLESWQSPQADAKRVYRPALLGEGSLHFIRASADLDRWHDTRRILPCTAEGFPDTLWEISQALPPENELLTDPEPGIAFSELPATVGGKSKFRSYKSQFKDFLYRHCTMTLYKCPGLSGYAPGGSTRAEARLHFQQLLREKRDLETEKLRAKYQSKMESLEKKIRTAEDRVRREESQYDQARWSTLVSVGSSILGAFVGGRRGGVATAARGVGRASQQRDDVLRAEQAVELLRDDLRELEHDLQNEIRELAESCDIDHIELESTDIAPRKSDLKTDDIAVLWTPWQVDDAGIAIPLFDTLPAGNSQPDHVG